MNYGRGLVFALLAVFLAGCANVKAVQTTTHSWLDRFRRVTGPQGPDVVQIDVALVERPAGDPYINGPLWACADEQVVALESKAILEDNGFRIGQIGGITPVELQTLLVSERTCANPRRIQLHADKSTTVTLGPETPVCQFRLERDGVQVPINLEQAQCTLEVVPTLGKDGRISLRFLPIVQHGKAALLPRPAQDFSGWAFSNERPSERYPGLGWEVTLAPNEYVVIGGRLERPHSLGHQCFVRTEEAAPVQRLLVIRTGTATPAPVASSPGIESADAPRSPPLACQAWITTRGKSE